MIEIIPPIDRNLIKRELTPDKFIRYSNKKNNYIYIIDAHNAPNTMLEIGRLRELSFRSSGGGSGNEIDTDEFDYLPKPYQQLIVWDPEEEKILGGYRFLHGKDAGFDKSGQPNIVTSHMFHFSDEFLTNYFPYTIDLGRAFIQPDYQSSKMGAKSLFALDNLWDGLGVLPIIFPGIKYLLGKVTIYPDYNAQCRDMVLYVMHKFFPDKDKLGVVKKAVFDVNHFEAHNKRPNFTENNLKENINTLNHFVRSKGEHIPPLINSYMKISATMRTLGTGINDEFGNIYDTGILVCFDDIYQEKKEHHISPYFTQKDRPRPVLI